MHKLEIHRLQKFDESQWAQVVEVSSRVLYQYALEGLSTLTPWHGQRVPSSTTKFNLDKSSRGLLEVCEFYDRNTFFSFSRDASEGVSSVEMGSDLFAQFVRSLLMALYARFHTHFEVTEDGEPLGLWKEAALFNIRCGLGGKTPYVLSGGKPVIVFNTKSREEFLSYVGSIGQSSLKGVRFFSIDLLLSNVVGFQFGLPAGRLEEAIDFDDDRLLSMPVPILSLDRCVAASYKERLESAKNPRGYVSYRQALFALMRECASRKDYSCILSPIFRVVYQDPCEIAVLNGILDKGLKRKLQESIHTRCQRIAFSVLTDQHCSAVPLMANHYEVGYQPSRPLSSVGQIFFIRDQLVRDPFFDSPLAALPVLNTLEKLQIEGRFCMKSL